jgi:iron(II)-dependent oxidoreductase
MSGMEVSLSQDESRRVEERLEQVRERTLSLISGVPWVTLRQQLIPILSPMVWDLGHIGDFEDIWINQRLGGSPPLETKYSEMFDAVENPRPTRASLPLPSGEELFRYLSGVRERTLENLWELSNGIAKSASSPVNPQSSDSNLDHRFVYEMVAVHEEQHQETLLQALQILEDGSFVPGQRRRLPQAKRAEKDMVLIPAGPFLMGRDDSAFAYDNEKGQHTVELSEYWIDRFPVTQGEYAQFVEAGGYRSADLWSPAGWKWRVESNIEAPPNWTKRDGQWQVRFMDRIDPIVPPLASKPVVHISYYEAEAYARFVGKRLPTEAEWEKAALWDPANGRSRIYPWGDERPDRTRANLDQLAFEPAEVGAYPAGVSAYGVEQMIGDVWEWTSSNFAAYPGFSTYPYPEYSEIFFGDEYKVLRGGSWATRLRVARGSFRNWDFPMRRQIFSGLRCAASSDSMA